MGEHKSADLVRAQLLRGHYKLVFLGLAINSEFKSPCSNTIFPPNACSRVVFVGQEILFASMHALTPC